MPLRIESGIEHDHFRLPASRGAYEWWYFDAYDAKRSTGFVCVFFLGIPFSGLRQRRPERNPLEFPAVSLSIYGPGGTTAYMVNLHPDAVVEPFAIRIGENTAALVDGTYEITLEDQLLDTSPLQARLRFTPEPTPLVQQRSGAADGDLWILAAPRCSVEAGFRIGERTLELGGIGYHDHNVGTLPLQERFRRWSWGRAHFSDSTFVYYDAEGLDGVRASFPSPARSSDFARNIYALRHPRELRIGDVTVRQDRIVDNGPFYLRFLSEFERGGERVWGFSEVLRPRALSWRWFWPMLDARVRPVGHRDRIGRRITHWLIRGGL